MSTVAVGGIWHETNTFSSTATVLEDFEAYQLAAGDEVLSRYEGVRNEVGGFLDGARQCRLTTTPTLFAAAVPSGVIDAAAYRTLADRLLDRLPPNPSAVLLALHGAMVVDGIPDADGELAAEVRNRVGPSVPIVATLDFHANVSALLFQATDALVGYRTYPHVDPYERGIEAAELAALLLAGGRVEKAMRKVPMLTPPQAQETENAPMRDVVDEVERVRKARGVLSVTLSPGFPYSDVPHAGLSVVAYAVDRAAAEAAAEEVADAAWDRRDLFTTSNVAPAEAVRQAMAADRHPVVLIDVADNIGGGSPGDGTVLLAELLRHGATGAVITIADAEAAAEAAQAGIGATVTLKVGGKSDNRHGEPVEVTGAVRSVTDGRFVHRGSYMTGQETNMGQTVVLDADGVEVVLTERRTMPFDAEQLRSQGIEPSKRRIIVVKAAIAWRAAYAEMAADAIPVGTPGICTSDLLSLPYTQVQRPMHPLDPIV